MNGTIEMCGKGLNFSIAARKLEVIDLNAMPLPDLFPALVTERALTQLVAMAREEDLGTAGDITSESAIPPDQRGGAAGARATSGHLYAGG